MRIAKRIGLLGTEQSFGVLARAKEMEKKGVDMIHMEIGDTDFDTPSPVKEACIRAIGENKTHYLPSQGLWELREAVAQYISRTRHINVRPEEVVITPGAKPIIFYVILATVNPGDEVIVPDPGFPAYASVVNFVGAKAVSLPVRAENNFNIALDELERLITSRTRLLVINSPHNPTGGILSHGVLDGISRLAYKHNLWTLSDEVYDRLIFEGEFESIASFPEMKERTVVLNAFTKTFSMSGWRLGYGVMNKELAKIIANLVNNSVSCVSAFVQWAGIGALNAPAVETAISSMREELRVRRDLLVRGLGELPGVKCHLPKGAIYVFPDIRQTGKSSREVFEILFEEAHVATLSGSAFGKAGEGFLRMSFGPVSCSKIAEAVERIKSVWHRVKA